MASTICSCNLCSSCTGGQATLLGLVPLTFAYQSRASAEAALSECIRIYNENLSRLSDNFREQTDLISQQITNIDQIISNSPADMDMVRIPLVVYAQEIEPKSVLPCVLTSLYGTDYSLSLSSSWVSDVMGFRNLKGIVQTKHASTMSTTKVIDIRGPLVLLESLNPTGATWILVDYVTQQVVRSIPSNRGFMGIIDPKHREINSKLYTKHFMRDIYNEPIIRRGRFGIYPKGNSALVIDTTVDFITRVFFPEHKLTLHSSIDYELIDKEESLIFRGSTEKGVCRFRVPFRYLCRD